MLIEELGDATLETLIICYFCKTRRIIVIICYQQILTTNLAAVVCVCVCVCVWMCVSVQNLTNFCPHALISNPNVPKILFA